MDLEQLRNDKCIPLARAILGDIALEEGGMIPQDANDKIDYNPIVMKMLQKSLNADTNIATENSYVIQLILGVFAGLNKTVQQCNTVPIDDVRYRKITRQILQILVDAGEGIRMGSVKPEETDADFVPVKEKLNVLFTEEKLSMLEVKYIMDNIFDSFTTITNLFNSSVEVQAGKAEAKLFGIQDMGDLSMKILDEKLK